MLTQKRQQIIVADSPVAPRSPIRWKQTLLDPIDHGARIHMQKSTYFVRRVNRLSRSIRLIHHLHKTVLSSRCGRPFPLQ
jgi:hypothetical protein